MDEKQLQFLYNEYAKNKGFKDFGEFKTLMSDSANRKMFFDESNSELGFKDYNEFEGLLGVKKKDGGTPSPVSSETTPLVSEAPSILPENKEVDLFALQNEKQQLNQRVQDAKTNKAIGSGGIGGSMIPMASTPQPTTIGEENRIEAIDKEISAAGYNPKEVHKVLDGIPPTARGVDVKQLVQESKDNPLSFSRHKAAFRWQSPLFRKIEAIEGDAAEAIKSDILQQSEYPTYEAARLQMRKVLENINKYVDNDVEKDVMIKQAIEDKKFAYGMVGMDTLMKDERYAGSDLNIYQINALNFLEDTNPDAFKAYTRLLSVTPDSQSGVRGYEYKLRELENIGLGLQDRASQEVLTDLANKFKKEGALSPEEQTQYQNLYERYEQVKREAATQKDRYPQATMLDADSFAQEALEKERNGAMKQFVLGVGEEVNDVKNWLGSVITAPFTSEKNEILSDWELLGEKKLSQQRTQYVTDKNSLFSKPVEVAYDKGLNDEIEKIKADETLSDSDKLDKVQQAIFKNFDQVGFIPKDSKFNFSANAWAHGISDIGQQLFAQIGIGYLTGGVGNVSKAKQLSNLFGTVYATAYNDYYTEALEKNIANPSVYATTHTAIEAASELLHNDYAMVKKMVNPKSTLGKLMETVTKEQWEAMAKAGSSRFKKIGKALVETGKQSATMSRKETIEEVAGQLAGNAVNIEAYNEDIPIEHGLKETAVITFLGMLPLGIVGVGGQYNKINRSQQYALYEAAQNPEKYLQKLDEAVEDGTVKKKDAEKIRQNIAVAVEVLKRNEPEGKTDNEKAADFTKKVVSVIMPDENNHPEIITAPPKIKSKVAVITPEENARPLPITIGSEKKSQRPDAATIETKSPKVILPQSNQAPNVVELAKGGKEVKFKAFRYGSESGADGVKFSSKNKDYSEEYATVKGGKAEDVTEVEVVGKNPLVVEMSPKEFASPTAEKKYIEQAKANGNDLVIFRDKENGDEFYAEIKPNTNETIKEERREEQTLLKDETPKQSGTEEVVADSTVPEVEVKDIKPIRQLGTGANVYYETDNYRVNDLSSGKFVLNIHGEKDGSFPVANPEFDSAKEAVAVAEKFNKAYPNGVPDAVLVDKVVDMFRKEASKPIETPKEKKQSPKKEGVISKATKIEDLTDPQDIVMQHFVSGGKINSSVIQKLFGNKSKSVEGEKRARISLLSKQGDTIEQLAHKLWEANPRHSTEVYRDAIEQVLAGNTSTGAMAKSLVDRYVNVAVKQEFAENEVDDKAVTEAVKAVEGLPEATQKELLTLLQKYENQYGLIDWNKLEEDTNGFDPEILSLSNETSKVLDEIIRKNNTPTESQSSNTIAKNEVGEKQSKEERLKAAQSNYEKATRKLKEAEDKVAKKQSTQTGVFGEAAQKELFGVQRDEVKEILDPLRAEVKRAKIELEAAQKEADKVEGPELFEKEKVASAKTKRLEELKEEQTRLVSGGKNNNGKFDKRIRQILEEGKKLAKEVGEVVVSTDEDGVAVISFSGSNIPYFTTSQVSELFFDVKGGKYVPNELGKSIGVKITDNSYTLKIDPAKTKEAEKILSDNGFNISESKQEEVKSEEERVRQARNLDFALYDMPSIAYSENFTAAINHLESVASSINGDAELSNAIEYLKQTNEKFQKLKEIEKSNRDDFGDKSKKLDNKQKLQRIEKVWNGFTTMLDAEAVMREKIYQAKQYIHDTYGQFKKQEEVTPEKQLADKIRSKKLKGGGLKSEIIPTFGLPEKIVNKALDLIADQVERGTNLGKAIAKAIRWIDEQVGGTKWDKKGFAAQASKTHIVTINGKKELVERDDSKETAEVINGFYSPLEQRLIDTKEQSLPAKKWIERLNSDEAKWTGLIQFLQSKPPTETISKKQIQDFLKENRIEISEVVKTFEGAKFNEDESWKRVSTSFGMVSYFNGDYWIHQRDQSEYELVRRKANDPFNETPIAKGGNVAELEKIAAEDSEEAGSPPKYSGYQLSGEKENYREVLVTLPVKKTKLGNDITDWYNRMVEKYGKGFNDKLNEQEKLEQADFSQNLKISPKNPPFKSSHWDEPNILVHLRLNTRKDSEGRRVLFIEELQSDWGQKGKREGFDSGKKNELPSGYKVVQLKSGNYAVKAPNGTFVLMDDSTNDTPEGAINDALIIINNSRTGLQAAPFVTDTNSWTKLGLKTALKYAVQEDAEVLAWTTGEQQNERYDLSKQVDKIDVTLDKRGYKVVYILGKDNSDGSYAVNDEGVIFESASNGIGDFNGRRLDEVVGKDLADKILSADKDTTYEGSDLKVGGKGMKGFYGEPSENKTGIIGSVAKSLVRELTEKEGEIKAVNLDASESYAKDGSKMQELVRKQGKLERLLDTVRNNKEYNEITKELNDIEAQIEQLKSNKPTQHSIPITPELKESVKQGMPLFGEAKPKSKLQQLADKIRKDGILPDFLKADLEDGTKLQGFGGKSLIEATARAIELVDAALQAGKEMAQAIEEGFAHIRDYYKQNTTKFDEDKLRAGFNAYARNKFDTGGIRHEDTEAIREEFGFPEYEKQSETFEQWEKEATERVENGELPKLIAKLKRGELPSEVEQRMLDIYITSLKQEARKNPSNENLKQLLEAVQLSDQIAGSEVGKSLAARKGASNAIADIGDYYVAKMEANAVDELTEEQKKEVQEKFAEYESKLAEETKKREEAEAYVTKLKAQKAFTETKHRAQQAKRKSKEDYVKERKDILQNIKDKWNKAGNSGTLTAVPVPYAAQLYAIAPDVAKLTRSFVEEGVDKLGDLVDQVHEVIKDVIPDITHDDVQALIAGDYNKKPTRTELAEKLYNLRQEARLLNQLAELESGVIPKDEKRKVKRNAKLKELRDKIKEQRRQLLGIEEDSETPLEKRYRQAIKKNREEAQKILDKINRGDFSKEKKVGLLDDLEFKKNNPKLYNELVNAAFEREEAKHKMELALFLDERKRRSKLKKAGDLTADIIGTTKAVVTTFDLSATFIQDVVPMLAHPKVGFKALGTSLSHLASERRFSRWLTVLHNSQYFDLIKKSGLDVTEPSSLTAQEKEETFDRNLLNKTFTIKGKSFNIGKYYTKPFERAFTSLGNVIRVTLFMRMAEKYYNQGVTFDNNPQIFKDLAKLLNTQTGRGTLPEWMQRNAKVASTVIWSPRLMASRLNLLGLGDIANPILAQKKGFYASLDPEIRKMAIDDMVRFISTVVLIYAGAVLLFGGDDDDVEADLDANSVTFGDLKVGNKSYNLFGGFSQYVKLVFQMFFGSRKMDEEVEDISDAKGKSRLDLGGRFIRGKVTPAVGVLADYADAKDYSGQPVTHGEQAKKLLTPLSLRETYKNINRDGVIPALGNTVIAMTGVNVKDDRDFYDNPLSGEAGKFLTNNKIKVPRITRENITVKKDEAHQDGMMTEAEFEKYKKRRIELMEDDVKDLMAKGWYVTRSKKVTADELVKDRDELEKVIKMISTHAATEAKGEMFKKTRAELRDERKRESITDKNRKRIFGW